MYIDWSYIVLVLPAVIFALWASARVNGTYKKYSKVLNARGLSGADAARLVLDQNGLSDVLVEVTSGELSDHYDPKKKVVRLSKDVYYGKNCASIGIACHEVGHAIQYAEHYAPAKIRMAIVPITNIGSMLSIPLIILGVVLEGLSPMISYLVYVGIACFGLSTIFQLVTLPTEFNASRRALTAIEENNFLYGDEFTATKKVLTAAALTYVAALAVSLMQLLRLVLIFGGRRD